MKRPLLDLGAWLCIVGSAIVIPVAILIVRDLSLKSIIIALVFVPIGAFCGLIAWGYSENLGRKD